MRLRTALVASVIAALAPLGPPAASADAGPVAFAAGPAGAEGGARPGVPGAGADPPPAADTRQPRCGVAAVKDFPIDTRMHGGPSVHHPGGGFEEWSVEVANTTGRPCRNIHPVLVFTARDRGLTADRLMLEFHDGIAPRWRPADLETSDEGEIVAVLGADGADGPGGTGGTDGADGTGGAGGGLTVPGRDAVTVRVRLALTADTPPNQVTVNAAIVQRRGDDGDWLGQSGDYRFAVLDDKGYGATVTRDELATTGSGSLVRLGAALGTVLLGGGALALVSRRLRPLAARPGARSGSGPGPVRTPTRRHD